MTTWINKDKFKEAINKEIIEGFADISLNVNPLTMFLQSNPLKSIFDREIVDSRNTEPFEQINPIDEQDNINPIGSPDDDNTKINDKSLSTNEIKHDEKLIDSIMISLFSLFITLYVSYNWYFNLTEGFTKRIQFYEKFDVVNYLYFFSEYFYKIVRFFDETISIKMPGLVKTLKESMFKERSIFILIFFISHFVVDSVISLLTRVYKYVQTYVKTGKINIMQLIYDPKSSNIYISLIFVYYVIEGIISSFKSSIIDTKMDEFDPNSLPNQSDSFKESLTSLKIAHPISYLIVVLIRVAIVYGPTVSLASTLFFIYFKFYSLLGIPYYLKFNSDPIDEANLYNGVREGSFLDMFRRIHAIINVNHVLVEIKDEPGNWFFNNIEKCLRVLFNCLPFIVMFFGLFKSIPSILKIYSPTYKWTGITIISLISIALLKFMADEYPQIYVLQQQLKNIINNTARTVSEVVSKINNDEHVPTVQINNELNQ